MLGMSNDMPDLTLEVLKDIRSDLREMKADLRDVKGDMRGLKTEMTELRTEMRAGFETLSQAIITGFVENEHEHVSLASRVARIEAHLKLG
jgi:hypothetical protein